jgi:beta-lactamase regulating signal transducer with metallopeptidase domain
MTPRVVLLLAGDYVLTVVLVKGTLLVLALLLIRLAIGRRSAATRSALWTVAAAGLLILPGLQYLMPVTPLSLLAFPAFLFQHDAGDVVRWAGVPAGPAAGEPFRWITSLPLAIWMAIVWFVGVAVLLGRFVRQLAAVRVLARESDPMPRATLRPCLPDGRPPASVRVRYSRAVTSPVTFGWWRPTILLPLEARTWPVERLASALSHELAHVGRRDYLVLLLTELLRALYWPNPFVWRVAAKMRVELEHACDDAVLRGGVNRIEYARHLLELASCQRMAPTAGALPMVRRSFFRARMRAILDDEADRAPVSRHVLVAAGVVWILLVGGLGGAGLWSCSGQTAAPAVASTSSPDSRPAAG